MTSSVRHSYYVTMIDYGRKGREAIVDPEITRQGVIDRIKSREYDKIAFIHFVTVGEDGRGWTVDVTNAMLAAAGFYREDAA